MPLKIALLGYYGHLNAGDDLLRNSMEQLLKEHRLMISAWDPPLALLNEADLIVCGGGSLWPERKFLLDLLKSPRTLKKPYMVIGISAKRKNEASEHATERLVNSSVFFHVRDNETKQALGAISRINVGADLFWWSEWEPTSHANPEPNTLALALRDTQDLAWQPHEIINSLRGAGLKLLSFPFYFGSPLHDKRATQTDSAFMSALGVDYPHQAWTPAPAQRSEVVIAMRYHAIHVAVRLGKPVIGLDCHPKIRSFFNENGLPELCIAPSQPAALVAAVSHVLKNKTEYEEKFKSLALRFINQGKLDRAIFLEHIAKIESNLPADRNTLRSFFSKFVRK